MTERLRSGSYANSNISAKMANDLTPRKTMLILVIVAGCFAVLWPKVFYPMLVGSANQHMKPSPIDKTTGCCDVISEIDVNTIKIMSELCRTIIKRDEDKPLTGREIVAKCQNAVLETCGIDISSVLQEQVKLGQTVKQILDEIRSLNGSLCLKYNFGVSPWTLGVPHRVTVMPPSSSIKQERPLQLRSEMVHPAFRERGRAIPQTQPSTPPRPPKRIVEGRPGPIPAMRPTLGGAGHVVPPPKQSTGSMGLIMPIYTIGIVIFFTYTVMKIVFKKQPEALYPPVEPDPHFRREVFESERVQAGPKLTREGVSNKLVVNAMSALLDEVDHEIESRRKTSEVANQDVVANGKVVNSQEEDQPTVKVLGMEMTASCEGGQKWSRPDSPVLPLSPPQAPEPAEPPQEIYLEGALPAQSHLLVADSATEAQKTTSEEDPAVVLSGKMTLSVISLDSSENGTDESSNSGKKQDERSSSNVSEEFEKIEMDGQLEDQINNIIEEAQLITEMVKKQDEPNLLEELENELKKIESESVITKLELEEHPDIQTIEEQIADTIEKTDNLPSQDIGRDLLASEIIESEKPQADIQTVDEQISDTIEKMGNVRLQDIEKELMVDIIESEKQQADIQTVEEQISHTMEKINNLPLQDIEKEFIVKEAIESEKQQMEQELIEKNGINLADEEKALEPELLADQKIPIDIEGEISKQLKEEIATESLQSVEPTKEKIIGEQELVQTKTVPVEKEEEKVKDTVELGLEIEKGITEALKEEKKSKPSSEKQIISEATSFLELDPLESVIASLTSEKLDEPTETDTIKETKVEEKQTENLIEPVVQSIITDVKKEESIVEKPSVDVVADIKEQTQMFTKKEIENEKESTGVKPGLQTAGDLSKKGEIVEDNSSKIPSEEPQQGVPTNEKETFDKLNEAIADLSSELKSASVEEKDRLALEEAPGDLEGEDEEEIEYEEYEVSDNEEVDEEIRNVDRLEDFGDREAVEHVNGDDQEQSKYVTTSSATLAENEISDDENLQNEDDEEIEEIIEYITDDEEEEDEEEVVQPPGRNNVNHVNERSGAHH